MENSAPSPTPSGLFVEKVDPRSPAFRAGLRDCCCILTINGQSVEDHLDLLYFLDDEKLEVEFLDENNARKRGCIEIMPQEDLGILPREAAIRRCANRCVFCFIEQNPPGLRPALYVKDEDYRFSFTHGQYITASTLKDEDMERIVRMRLAPLYFSIHTTDHELRCRMLGRPPEKTRSILAVLERFQKEDLDFHGQIVLCPGWNDGAHLERSLDDLETFLPQMLSLAIVPVGLTAHRNHLPPLSPCTPEQAQELIPLIQERQERLEAEYGEKVILLSDEFYLLAGETPPPYHEEERLCQLENGVAMMAEFWEGWEEVAKALPPAIEKPFTLGLFTGALGKTVLRPVVERLNAIHNLKVHLIVVDNHLYGKSVTVSGLLSGRDLNRSLEEWKAHLNAAFFPDNMLRDGDALFLDNWRLDDLQKRCPDLPLRPLPNRAAAIWETLSGLIG